MAIELRAPIPKYYRLADSLRERIEGGEWQPEQPIPSERDLEVLYDLSRTTVRQALDVLVKQGYLSREHGRGTFVSRAKMPRNLRFLSSFTNEMRRQGFEPGQRLLEMGFVQASARIRQCLDLPPGADVFRIARVRLCNGEPVGINITYLPLNAAQAILPEELDGSGSLWSLLEAKLGRIPTEADEVLEATIADDTEAALLGIREGSPLLLIERTVLAQDRRPMDFSKMLYRADRYQYYVHMTQPNSDADAGLVRMHE